MEQIPCVHCGTFFIPRNRKQNYCTQPACQRGRKAAWQRYKMKTDADYRTQQKLSHQKWVGQLGRIIGSAIVSAIPIKPKETGHFSTSATAAGDSRQNRPPQP
jgi:hypothetical protein